MATVHVSEDVALFVTWKPIVSGANCVNLMFWSVVEAAG